VTAGGRSGILLIDKPQGLTSHDVVARTRKLANTKKVGHAGTLDPMATGLLVVGLNAATRLLTYFVGLDKEYQATIRLGQASTTDDAEGELSGTTDSSAITEAQLSSAIANLTGSISQVPSTVSAIKIDGKRAYARARAGEEVALDARSVTVSAFEVLRVSRGVLTDVEVRVECSSGTYVRALARDLGGALGVGGHLTALRRTRVGPFAVAEATAIAELDVDNQLVAPATAAARLFPVLALSDSAAIDLAHGKTIAAEGSGTFAAIAPDGRLVGLARVDSGAASPIVNFPQDGLTQ
jgi:tRNA pseudouridine55 synthase